MKFFPLVAGLGLAAGQIPLLPVITTRVIPLVSPPLIPVAQPVQLIAKCPVGSPLKNAAGLEFFCGVGPGHQDCPVGSQCIVGPNQVYAACCQTTAATANLGPLPVPPSTSLVTPSGTPISTVQGGANIQTPSGGGQLAFTTGAAGTAFTASAQGVSSSNFNMNTESSSSESDNSTSSFDNSTSSSDNSTSSSSEGSGESSTAEVRYLTIQNLPSGEGIAMWAPPNGTQCQTLYTAEFSSDGQNWRKLAMEQPFATWAMFPLSQSQPQFQVRVSPEHGMPMIANGQPGKGKGQQLNQQQQQPGNQQSMNNQQSGMIQQKNMNQQQFGTQQQGNQQADENLNFLFVQNLSPTEGLAMWADSNATACETQYTAEISYDGQQWRKLSMDQPTDNWVLMSVTAGSQFQIRVTPENGTPMIGMSKPKGGKNGKAKH